MASDSENKAVGNGELIFVCSVQVEDEERGHASADS